MDKIKANVEARYPDVKIKIDEFSNLWLTVGRQTMVVKYSYGRVFMTSGDDEFDPKTVEEYSALSLAFAALAEFQEGLDQAGTSLAESCLNSILGDHN